MQLLVNIFLTFSLYLVIALSYSHIYYVTRFFHLAHGGVITAGAYLALLFYQYCALPMLPAFLLAVIGAAGIGLLCELLVYRRMRRRNALPLTYLVASLGIYVILQNVIVLFFGNDARILNNAEVTVGHRIGSAYITTFQLALAITSWALFLGVTSLLRWTSIGRSIRAVASNPELCVLYGIPSERIIAIVFIFGSAIAAIAGIAAAMDLNMNPAFGFNLLLYGIVVMIVGGVRSTRGLVLGALLVASAQNCSSYFIDTKWLDAVTYLILIVFLIIKPLGFSGKRLRKLDY